ncbi:MFS transporter [Taklimakanibacter deserti]|uniref:MFS transporter n=1 Tax=Taklimakanibacter deserti TaxID=2267839 RepID=UPI000E65BC69
MPLDSQACVLPQDQSDRITLSLILLFAFATGVIVTNLFAPQTLIGLIGPSLGLSESGAGLTVMAPLIGYSAGLFFVVPLADLVENRRLVLLMLGAAVLAAAASALAPGILTLLAAFFVLGMASSVIQVLVPIAASLAAPDRRGAVIGDVMSGLMIGILLSRPLASLLAAQWGWRAFYGSSAVAMMALGIVLAFRLPPRAPRSATPYPALIASLWTLFRGERALRQRSLTAGLVMAAFSLFWSAVALELSRPPFSLGQYGIAVFALLGAGGACATSLFGRLGDRGWTRPATMASHGLLIVAMSLAAWAGWAGNGAILVPLAALATSAFLLDFAVTGDQTLGRRAVNLLNPESRGRLNGIFVGLFFVGGAIGSAISGLLFAEGGWPAICFAAALFGLVALIAQALARQ